MLILHADPDRVRRALHRVAGLVPAPTGTVRVYVAAGFVAVEGVGDDVARGVAQAVGGSAAIVEVGITGDVHRAMSRRAGGDWVDEGAEAEDCLDEWTEGEPWKVAHFDGPFEADLGAWLLDGEVEFRDAESYASTIPLPPRLEGAVRRIRAGSRWQVVEQDGRVAVRIDGSDGSRELVFVTPGEVELLQTAVTEPEPPPEPPLALTVQVSPGRFTVEEAGSVLISGRYRVERGPHGPLDLAEVLIVDVRARLDPHRAAELVWDRVVVAHRSAFGAIDAVRLVVGSETFGYDAPPLAIAQPDPRVLAGRVIADAVRERLVSLRQDPGDLEGRVAEVLDRCRRRSAGRELAALVSQHRGVAEVHPRCNPRALQSLVVDAATILRGSEATSTTGWV